MSDGAPRSWLFTPGSRPDRFAKAMETTAEAVILDLEDAVAEERKPQARNEVLAFLAGRPAQGPRIAVRINPLNRRVGLEDLAALAQLWTPPDYVVVPKAEEPVELALAAQVLGETPRPLTGQRLKSGPPPMASKRITSAPSWAR